MISIRLNPAVFSPGGFFYGVDTSRAVLTIGTGKAENYAGVIKPAFPLGSLSYRGGQFGLFIDSTGTQLSDYSFEVMIKNTVSSLAYGLQIVDFVDRNLIIVEQNGVALTSSQIRAFVAPP